MVMTCREAGDERTNLLARHMTLVHDLPVSEVYMFSLCMCCSASLGNRYLCMPVEVFVTRTKMSHKPHPSQRGRVWSRCNH